MRRAHGCRTQAIRQGAANSPVRGDYFTVIQQHIERSVRRTLADTPVVLLDRARQTGKTTLARAFATRTGAEHVTIDVAATLAAADPVGFTAKGHRCMLQ
jgi:MoxR-like ATPase